MWECGLKHPTVCAFWFQKTVTPYVGVWIETLVRPTRMSSWKSLLMWECGLKQGRRHIAGWLQGHSLCGSVDWNIETTAGFEAAVSHSLCGSVDWNRSNGQRVWESPWSLLMWECGLKLNADGTLLVKKKSLLMWECGLKHSSWRKWCRLWRHSLCGSVDWNSRLTMNWNHKEVTPYVGVWIETQRTVSCGYPKKVTPYVGVWIETEETKKAGETAAVTPYVGVWIETQPYMSL